MLPGVPGDRPWVEFEVDYFLGAGKPIFWVRIPNTTGAASRRLQRQRGVAFSPEAIYEGLRSCRLA